MFLDVLLVIHRNHIEAYIVIVCVRFDLDNMLQFETILNLKKKNGLKISNQSKADKIGQEHPCKRKRLNFHATYMIEIRPD